MSTPPDASSSNEDSEDRQHTPDPETAPSSPAQEAEKPEEATPPVDTSTLPPEAQGETNGGPLGCCLGVMVGLLLSLSVAVLSRLYATELAQVFSTWLSTVVRIVMLLVAIGAVIICGYFGWKIGKRAYREYDAPVIKRRGRQ